MIDRKKLLSDLKPLLREMESDLRARCDEVPQINSNLTEEYNQARAANRVGTAFEEWRVDLITQVAAAWVLSCVFVRFLEDNFIISPPRISGPLHAAGDGEGLMRARDERDIFFRSHPKLTDRDYLLAVFDDLAKLPGTKEVFGPHNLVNAYRDWLSGDAAQRLIEFSQKIDTDGTGEIVHNFKDKQWDTRFLGDLYQDLSEAARKKYALLQTPDFVEEFILERTLEPAIKEFGLKNFKMIDPACGSGHFVLGGFARILDHWRKAEPGTNVREIVNRVLASVHGVDINPYAIAIARFRLLLMAMRECRITRLKDAPNFQFNLVCGDSLLHGSIAQEQQLLGFHELSHHYQCENINELRRILAPGQYHAVVANPPYITVKDTVLNQAYRERHPDVCYMKYSLVVPFVQRLFSLAIESGFTGQIAANSFMKREFGKKLVENYLTKVDMTHVIDTAGAYIPGHGTPTVIIFGRQRRPVSVTVRAIMGIRGEPATPANPAQGLVWCSILDQIDRPGSQSSFIGVRDAPRDNFQHHPWSIGGGGVAELKELLDKSATSHLDDSIISAGVQGMTNAEDVMVGPHALYSRVGVEHSMFRPIVAGEDVRDWRIVNNQSAFFPYKSSSLVDLNRFPGASHFLWNYKTCLGNRATFSKQTYFAEGRPWWEWHQLTHSRVDLPRVLSFANIATHNHVAIDCNQFLHNVTVVILQLRASANEDDHLALLGLLNSSTACFWLKQVTHNKGSTVDERGARQRTAPFEDFFAYNAKRLEQFPLPASRPLFVAKQIDSLAREFSGLLPSIVDVGTWANNTAILEAREEAKRVLGKMIALQEELDWQCYCLYGLLPMAQAKTLCCEFPPPILLGQRAFEIVLARRVESREEETSWFTRHGSTPVTEIPADWPDEYKRVVQKRIDVFVNNKDIGLIERPEYKRRWTTEPWEKQLKDTLHSWLLIRIESYFDLDGRMNEQKTVTSAGELNEPRLISIARVADLARQDKDFMQVAELYTARMDFTVASLVGDLITAESVPCLPVLRYKPTGLDKRAVWERTWVLQRLEDAVDALFEVERLKQIEPGKAEATLRPRVAALPFDNQIRSQVLEQAIFAAGVIAESGKQGLNLAGDWISREIKDAAKRAKKGALGDIPVPPAYTSADFQSNDFWRLRGVHSTYSWGQNGG